MTPRLLLILGLLVQALFMNAQEHVPPSTPHIPSGLPRIDWPADNPYSPARAELGRILFFDGRLSSNGVVACAFCHKPEHAFSGDTALSIGVDGQPTGRHTPTLIDRAWGKTQFWDGRAPTLEAQSIIPITHPHEMGMTADRVVQVLESIPGYAPLFAAAFGNSTITFDRVSKALATFERTIISGDSAFDRFAAGDKSAMTKEQKAGYDFFNGKGECAECHKEPLFTDEKFANLGVSAAKVPPDAGRAEVTKKKGDRGKFKVPTLRDLSSRGPYMHDGSLKTLGDVLDFYAKGGTPNPQLDTRLLKFYMDPETKRNLLAFLEALNGTDWQQIKPPQHFPQ